VSEAAANVILHAYRRQPGRPIELTVEADPDRASVCLCHEGEGFDPESVPAPVFDQGRESGFGLHVIRQSVDEVQYFVDERGRRGVRLVKNLVRGQGAGVRSQEPGVSSQESVRTDP
jgi:anti-sigma regulatory factor (Ser/Thr protein kinase)